MIILLAMHCTGALPVRAWSQHGNHLQSSGVKICQSQLAQLI